MGLVSYYECDKCGRRLTKQREDDGAIAITRGSTVASLCMDCQKTTTVFESKEIARRVLAENALTLHGKRV